MPTEVTLRNHEKYSAKRTRPRSSFQFGYQSQLYPWRDSIDDVAMTSGSDDFVVPSLLR